eukprot:jgi/Mesvir1/5721/Mv09824-RA.1
MLYVQSYSPFSLFPQGLTETEDLSANYCVRIGKSGRGPHNKGSKQSHVCKGRPFFQPPKCCFHSSKDSLEPGAHLKCSNRLILSRRNAGMLLFAACLGAQLPATAMPVMPLTDDPENMSPLEVERLLKRFGELHMPDKRWRELLPPDAYDVMRMGATEPRFSSQLAQEKRAGSFLCHGCSTPVFRSERKYDSGTGWPSFTEAIPGAVTVVPDHVLGFWERRRPEVRCRRCQSHLGHILTDGPPPTGLRYCMNGVALLFRPDPICLHITDKPGGAARA